MTLASLLWIVALGGLLGLVARRETPSRYEAPGWLSVLVGILGMAAGWLLAQQVSSPTWLTYALPVATSSIALFLLPLVVAVRRRSAAPSVDQHDDVVGDHDDLLDDRPSLLPHG